VGKTYSGFIQTGPETQVFFARDNAARGVRLTTPSAF